MTGVRAALEAAAALHRAGRLTEAEKGYRDVLAADPNQADALSLLGQILHHHDNSDEALELMVRARRLRPDSAPVTFNLGRLYLDLHEWEKAAEVNRDVLRIAPDHAAAFCNLGIALIHLGRAAAGEDAIRKSLHHDPANAPSWSALGLALARQDRTGAAREAFEKARAIDPALAEASFNLSELLLGEMDFADGWSLFAARAGFDRASFTTGGAMPPDIPLWRGEDLAGKSILVWGEQGVGDQILFAGLIPDLARGVGRITLACDPRLAPLLARSFPGADVVPQNEDGWNAIAARRFDAAIALASLGQFLRPDRRAFAAQRAYLVPDFRRAADLKSRYKELSKGLPVVGVSWRSSRHDIGAAKSIPIDAWVPMLRGVSAAYVSLQYGETGTDIARARELGLTLHTDPEIDPLADIDGQAAQIAALDLVVSVSNTTVHLGGGLGTPVWTLAPLGAGRMWYWFQPATPSAPSLWYPSMRIYHQRAPGDWSAVIEQVRNDLRAYGA